jgi:sialic acid synthase SpsE
VIEKHFTDDKSRSGPDHPFAMDKKDFKEMVTSIRKLEKALGSSKKDIYEEENETVILQRRCLRASKDISKGTVITEEMVDVLRPAPEYSLPPKYKAIILGKSLKLDIRKGEEFTWDKFI